MSFAGSSSDPVSKFKSFVSESELEERKKKRQEEWEKIRKPDQPLEAPEEEYDPKSLYERLQEQKDKRQAEYEEAHRLKNLIKGLDDDEVAFLELVDKTKIEMESQRWKEEFKEIQEYRKAVAHISEEASEAKLQDLRKKLLNQQSSSSTKKSQQSLLAGALKRKRVDASSSEEKKSRLSDSEPLQEVEEAFDNEVASGTSHFSEALYTSAPETVFETTSNISSATSGSLQCMGVLPGLGAYSDSSDSENSSNSEAEKDCDFDLIGRRRVRVHPHHHS